MIHSNTGKFFVPKRPFVSTINNEALYVLDGVFRPDRERSPESPMGRGTIMLLCWECRFLNNELTFTPGYGGVDGMFLEVVFRLESDQSKELRYGPQVQGVSIDGCENVYVNEYLSEASRAL